jgi:hypothetical protein
MKIEAHVTALVDLGDRVKVTAQGNAVGRAEWVPMVSIELSLPLTEQSRAAYFIGRTFEMTVKPS